MNIIYIYADDLGRGMLSCYGQTHFQTPNIDRLAAEGTRFSNAYGCAVCAPARASLLTGYHDCHAGAWSYTAAGIYRELSTGGRNYDEIRELINNTSFNERSDEVFLPHIARQAGLVTGQIGKLEWGFATTPERLAKHGWDYHYGYYDHARCHGFYPPFLFENGEMVEIPGNEHADCGVGYHNETPEKRQEFHSRGGMEVYSQDLFNEKIEAFIRDHKDEPFFLYHPSQLPHGPIATPEVHPGVRDAEGLTLYEKEYASMILRLDDTVGLIYDTLEELGILDDTVIIFSADNGHESSYYMEEGRCSGTGRTLDGRSIDHIDLNYTSEASGDVFDGNDGMSGCKRFTLEGGVRIPFIVRGPGNPTPGAVNEHLLANYDTMATMADLLDVPYPEWKDGLSFLPTLRGGEQAEPDYVVFAGNVGPALVTPDGWKVRYLTPVRRFQLFYLPDDCQETNNLATQKPEKLKEMATLLLKACDGNMYHGTWENHKSVRVDELLAGHGPEEAFPGHRRWQG
ncbi:MAG: sulfatase-like hydrolase/transferase [Kiritimatiellae bacterium]|nr:sulfatase-like hydrolase/transferase [Kiritimatiellia bacterium]